MRTVLLIVALLGLAGQPAQRPVVRSGVTYVTTDLVARNDRGQFVANLNRADFEVFEDGVKQEIVRFVLTHGGRVMKDVAGLVTQQDGVLLPPSAPYTNESGRVFLVFLDDLHLTARDTPRLRDLMKKIAAELIHEGDLFGIVSSGYSSIAIDMTYDRRRLEEATNKIMGAGLMPSDIIGTPEGSQGPAQVRHNAHVAFSAAYEILQKLEKVHDRRKAFIYISSGYDFDPFAKSRAKAMGDRFPSASSGDSGQVPETNPFSKTGNQFAAADLAAELSELTRQANRSNTTIYTIDPRGLVGGPDIDQATLDSTDWQDYVRETQSSLRVIAELTGGIAGVNMNDFTRLLKRIDADTSDYYVLGYYSNNPDPLKRRRNIEIKVKKPKLQLTYKTSYTLKPER